MIILNQGYRGLMPWGMYLLTNILHLDRRYLGITQSLGIDLKTNMFHTI
jgi:hypothetical protein